MDYGWVVFGGAIGAIFGAWITSFDLDRPVLFRNTLVGILSGIVWTFFYFWIEVHKGTIGWRLSMQDFVVGTLIGVATAPWCWLHFARKLSAGTKAETGETEAETGDLARY